VAEDVLVTVEKFMFPVDSVIMDIEEDVEVPLILGRPFMKTARVIIDVDNGKLKVRVQDEEVNFNVLDALHHPKDKLQSFKVDVLDEVLMMGKKQVCHGNSLERALIEAHGDFLEGEEKEIEICLRNLNSSKEVPTKDARIEQLSLQVKGGDQKLELKMLPPHLKYVFHEEGGRKSVIISSSLTTSEEERVIKVLKAHKRAIGWSLSDIKGISPIFYMHRIHMEEDFKPIAQP
jgi:hypothetical protein